MKMRGPRRNVAGLFVVNAFTAIVIAPDLEFETKIVLTTTQ